MLYNELLQSTEDDCIIVQQMLEFVLKIVQVQGNYEKRNGNSVCIWQFLDGSI